MDIDGGGCYCFLSVGDQWRSVKHFSGGGGVRCYNSAVMGVVDGCFYSFVSIGDGGDLQNCYSAGAS